MTDVIVDITQPVSTWAFRNPFTGVTTLTDYNPIGDVHIRTSDAAIIIWGVTGFRPDSEGVRGTVEFLGQAEAVAIMAGYPAITTWSVWIAEAWIPCPPLDPDIMYAGQADLIDYERDRTNTAVSFKRADDSGTSVSIGTLVQDVLKLSEDPHAALAAFIILAIDFGYTEEEARELWLSIFAFSGSLGPLYYINQERGIYPLSDPVSFETLPPVRTVYDNEYGATYAAFIDMSGSTPPVGPSYSSIGGTKAERLYRYKANKDSDIG